MLSRNQFLKAAAFTGAMMFIDYCFEHAAPYHHHHHHHYHYHNVEEVVVTYLVKLLEVTATGLITASRFGASAYTNNSSLAMAGTEFGISYLTPRTILSTSLLKGIVGAGVAMGINRVFEGDQQDNTAAARRPRPS